MKVQIICAALVLVGSTAAAEQNGKHRCHSYNETNARLACYDNLTNYSAAKVETKTSDSSATSTQAATGKQWKADSESSVLDGREDVWLSVSSQNTEPNAIGSPIRAYFYVRCMENRTNAFISFDRFTTDDQNVKYRIDKKPVTKIWMEAMRGGEGIGIWSGGKAIPFVKKLFGHEKLAISYDTYTGPVEFVFDVSGLKNRIGDLAKSCQWSP